MRNRPDIDNTIVNFIDNYILEHGYSPSYREIGEASGLSSTSSVCLHIRKLVDAGLIITDVEASARAICSPRIKMELIP